MAPYFVGCPVWSCPHWRGSVFGVKAPKDKWLNQYSGSFNTVEGNSTFYGIPRIETFQRWAEQVNEGFRFALKFPRAISHEKQMQNVELETDQFLRGLDALHSHNRLGPTFLQLSPTFGPQKFNLLASYLERLPKNYSFAVEVRHRGWFEGEAEVNLNRLLSQHNMDRVIFDSRPLFSCEPADEVEKAAQHRKPRVPIRTTVTGKYPMLRFIGKNDVLLTKPWIKEWVPTVADWIANDLTPFVFAHTPDDRFAPEFARLFHNALAEKVESVEPIDEWPFTAPKQRELF